MWNTIIVKCVLRWVRNIFIMLASTSLNVSQAVRALIINRSSCFNQLTLVIYLNSHDVKLTCFIYGPHLKFSRMASAWFN